MVLSALTIVFIYAACCHYGALSRPHFACQNFTLKVTGVQMMNRSIDWINHYSADKY